MNLNRKVVAITGAYSGLGAALSKMLAKKGCRLVLGGRNKEKLEEFAENLNSDAATVVMDVRNKDDCRRFVNAAEKKLGHLDVLVNNAGILAKLSNIEEVTEEELRDTFETNVFGVIYCTQAATKIMKRQRNGIIINIGSTSAIDYKSSHIAYGSSKCAVVGLTGMLNKELNEFGIKALCVSPGGMKTSLFRNQPGRKTADYMDPKFVADKIVRSIENPPEEWHIIVRRPQ